MPASTPKPIRLDTVIQKLPPGQGGYHFLEIESAVVQSLPMRKATRLCCRIDHIVEFPCGLNHLGNGNYFIIVAARHLKHLGKQKGEQVQAVIWENPEPLGVPMPDVLQALLDQDEELNAVFAGMTDGKKRSLIFLVSKIKNVDLQVQKATRFLTDVRQGVSPFRKA